MAYLDDKYMYVCPQCGNVNCYFNGSCNCGLSATKLVTTEFLSDDVYIDTLSDDEIEATKEKLREKYCYNSPLFSQEENEKRIQEDKEYDEDLKNWQKQEELKASWIPRCPICQSTELSEISAFGRLAMVNIGKTWECKNCGSKF